MGINTGRLGFLADISPEEMEETFDEIYNNHYKVEERSVLQLRCDDERLMQSPYALNEIAVLKRDSSSMISIHAAINGAPLTTPKIADVIDDVYNSVLVNGTHKAPSIKVAEASKIIENSQRDVNIAFMNELLW